MAKFISWAAACVLFLFGLVLSDGIAQNEKAVHSNDDIEWKLTHVGLLPVPRKNSVSDNLLADSNAISFQELLDALQYEDQFISAHVLLSYNFQKLDLSCSFSEWNGLSVEVLDDGAKKINPQQRQQLIDRWSHFGKTHGLIK